MTHKIIIYYFLHQALHYNQIYNFALNHNHKFQNITIIKTFKHKINNIIVDVPKIFNTSATKITHVALFMKYFIAHNKFQNIWWRFN
jgi:hypothetical protein